ncbi:hypothetical protein HK097_008237 [Rhizophlyctis rosea]|uniref:Uncharacterized protein n=1 Tax=Rhizophlyctis rosea TaxID=64517 RepID=A0AAD5X424_9FUNG|nr:hypothetical protein HK097_008237 [Rhizophlyctis rosea]
MRDSKLGTGGVVSFLPTILYLLSLAPCAKGQTQFNQPRYDSWGTGQLPFEIPTTIPKAFTNIHSTLQPPPNSGTPWDLQTSPIISSDGALFYSFASKSSTTPTSYSYRITQLNSNGTHLTSFDVPGTYTIPTTPSEIFLFGGKDAVTLVWVAQDNESPPIAGILPSRVYAFVVRRSGGKWVADEGPSYYSTPTGLPFSPVLAADGGVVYGLAREKVHYQRCILSITLTRNPPTFTCTPIGYGISTHLSPSVTPSTFLLIASGTGFQISLQNLPVSAGFTPTNLPPASSTLQTVLSRPDMVIVTSSDGFHAYNRSVPLGIGWREVWSVVGEAVGGGEKSVVAVDERRGWVYGCVGMQSGGGGAGKLVRFGVDDGRVRSLGLTEDVGCSNSSLLVSSSGRALVASATDARGYDLVGAEGALKLLWRVEFNETQRVFAPVLTEGGVLAVGSLLVVERANSTDGQGTGPASTDDGQGREGGGLSKVAIALIVIASLLVVIFLILFLFVRRRKRYGAKGRKDAATVQELDAEVLGDVRKTEGGGKSPEPYLVGAGVAALDTTAKDPSSSSNTLPLKTPPTPFTNATDYQTTLHNRPDSQATISRPISSDHLSVHDQAPLVPNKADISRTSNQTIVPPIVEEETHAPPSNRYSSASETDNESTVVGALIPPNISDERRSSVGTVKAKDEKKDTVVPLSLSSSSGLPTSPEHLIGATTPPLSSILGGVEPDWKDAIPLGHKTSFGSFATVESREELPRGSQVFTGEEGGGTSSWLSRKDSQTTNASSRGYEAESEASLSRGSRMSRGDVQSRHSSFTSFASARTGFSQAPSLSFIGESPAFVPGDPPSTLTRRRSRRAGGSLSSKTSVTPSDAYVTADERRVSQNSGTGSNEYATATEGGPTSPVTDEYNTAPEGGRGSFESDWETAQEELEVASRRGVRGKGLESSTEGSFVDAEEGSDEEVSEDVRAWRLSQVAGGR